MLDTFLTFPIIHGWCLVGRFQQPWGLVERTKADHIWELLDDPSSSRNLVTGITGVTGPGFLVIFWNERSCLIRSLWVQPLCPNCRSLVCTCPAANYYRWCYRGWGSFEVLLILPSMCHEVVLGKKIAESIDPYIYLDLRHTSIHPKVISIQVRESSRQWTSFRQTSIVLNEF